MLQKIACLALFAAVLAGCADQSAPHDLVSGGPEAGGNAVILVGLRVVQEPAAPRLFGLGGGLYHPAYEVGFRQVEDHGTFGRIRRSLQICEPLRGTFNGILSDCKPDQVEFHLLSVPPGRYTLDYITYQIQHVRSTTMFNRTSEVQSSLGTITTAPRLLDPALSFLVGPGSVTYIGDLSFSFSRVDPGARVSLENSDAAAAKALEAYPNVRGTRVFHPAFGSPPAGSVADTP